VVISRQTAFLLALVALSFAAGCSNRRAADSATAGTSTPAVQSQPPGSPEPEDPREPEPRAVESRAAAIQRDAAVIREQYRRAGGWQKWERDTAPYRAALKAKAHLSKQSFGSHGAPIEGLREFPLFETDPRSFLGYLWDPERLETFRRERPVLAARNWLAAKGIDLVFVPVPKMTEVYVEHFVDPWPPDGVIAPHVRRTLLELLEQDVETVDGFRVFRPVRDADPYYLYNTADSHWAPRGWRTMAKEVAGRIERYKFGARARAGERRTKVQTGPYKLRVFIGRYPGEQPPQDGWDSLTDRQKSLAEQAQPKTADLVTPADDRASLIVPASPVMLIGDSFVNGFCDYLVDELNLPVSRHSGANQTTEAFADFLREPELLAHTRVVVWVMSGHDMTICKPLPESIADCREAVTSPTASPPAREPASPR
jgi:hypothetical protein